MIKINDDSVRRLLALKTTPRNKTLAGLVGGLAIVVAGCGTHTAVAITNAGNPTTQGATLLQGNFSDPAQLWPTSADHNQSVSANGNTYTVQLGSAGSFAGSPSTATVLPQDLADVSVSTSVAPTTVHPGDTYGIFCRSLQGHSYSFQVGPQSSGKLAWSIQLHQTFGIRQLASGTAAVPNTTPYEVRGDCIQGGVNHKPVVLALYLSGKLAGQAQDSKLPAPYVGRVGLNVSSAHGGTTVDFSNFQLRAASAS